MGELVAVGAGGCSDENANCLAWARRKQCDINPEYMLLNCKKSCNVCVDTGSQDSEPKDVVTIKALVNKTAGAAQLSAPFGVISKDSVEGALIGINCDASGPPAAHGTNCGCLKYNGEVSPSVGTLTVFRPVGHDAAFYLAGPDLKELEGKSVVVHCGSTFGDKAGEPLFCAALV